MKNYIVYNTTSGEIIKSGRCPECHVLLQAGEGQEAIATDQSYPDDQFYWDGTEISARPDFMVEVNGNVIEGVPAGTILTIEGTDYQADGEDIEFEPSHAGTYEIGLRLFPFKPATIEVTA